MFMVNVLGSFVKFVVRYLYISFFLYLDEGIFLEGLIILSVLEFSL